jgi:hypothetical protein
VAKNLTEADLYEAHKAAERGDGEACIKVVPKLLIMITNLRNHGITGIQVERKGK